MNNLFTYYEGDLVDFIDKASKSPGYFIKCVISTVEIDLVEMLCSCGIELDYTWKHTLDNCAVSHILKVHGSDKELLRGQAPVTVTDLVQIHDIVEAYDTIAVEKNRRAQDIIIYSKKVGEVITYYVEEVRLGRHELAASTMYKRKKENSPTLMG